MISVIIPVYNGEKYLDECLSSIDDAEIVVIDDASTDKSAEIARKYTDLVITIEHSGPVIARNIGLKNAHGEYVVFMDADDVFVSKAIKNMHNEIMGNDAIIGLRQDFISPDCPDIVAETKKSSHGVISGCAMFKKSVFKTVGDFDSDLLCGDGYEWLLRAKKFNLKIKNSDTVFCMRRIHNSNMGKTMAGIEKSDYIKIIKKHFIGKQ